MPTLTKMVAPPTAVHPDPQALIEEARQRARRRRRRTGALAALVVAAGLATFFALRGGGGSSSSAAARANPAARALQSGGQLTVIGIPTGGRQQPVAHGDGWYGLSAVDARGRLRYLVRCPGHAKWCGEVESIDWSSNGRWLALSVTSVAAINPYNGIHVVDVRTGVDHQIRSCLPPECDWFDLDWSPDGTRLVYVAQERVYVVDRDGSHPHELPTEPLTPVSSPSWSPDGNRIAFATRRTPRARSSVYVMRLDGHKRRLIADGASSPAWSPSGQAIAVASRCGGIKLFTSAGRDVTPGGCLAKGISGVPAWSPDGKEIAVAGRARLNGHDAVYVMNADGSHLHPVTRVTGSRSVIGGFDVAWQPRG